MAHDGDEENQMIVNTSNEETPLLSDHQSEEHPEVNGPEPEPERRKASWYIWRVLWVIVAGLILAAFIKGWIDAGGDVDVSS